MDTFFSHMSVAPDNLFAAFVGSLVAVGATAGPRPNPWAIFCTMLVGVGCGSYLGPVVPLSAIMPASWNFKSNAIGSFVIGVVGMPLSRKIIRRMRASDGD